MMMVFRQTLVAALIGVLSVAATVQAAEPMKIGVINPLSGALALYGNEVTRGYELAADQINARGGLNGRKIELVRGDAANPQQGIATVEQLANKDKVDLFIGTYISAVSNAASDAAMRYDKLYWDTNALAADLTERGLPNFVRAGPYASSFAAMSAEAIRDLIAPALSKDVKGLKVWIEHEDSIYGTSIAQAQKKMLEGFGAKVIGVGAHAYKSIDLNDSVLRAKQAGPDVWVQTGYVPDGNLLLRTAREQGFKPPATLFVGTGDTPETLESVGAETLDGVLVVSYPRPDIAQSFGPGSREYLKAYQAKYHADPIAPQAMTAFVGAQILFEAVGAANSTDPEKVRAAAAKLDKPIGSYATGYGVKFDQNFQNQRAHPTVVQWQGGTLATVHPAKAVNVGVKLQSLAGGR